MTRGAPLEPGLVCTLPCTLPLGLYCHLIDPLESGEGWLLAKARCCLRAGLDLARLGGLLAEIDQDEATWPLVLPVTAHDRARVVCVAESHYERDVRLAAGCLIAVGSTWPVPMRSITTECA